MTAVRDRLQHIRSGMTPGVRDLIWEVFFASRGRGVSLDAHFPWLADAGGTHCLWVQDDRGDESAAAALVIRERELLPNLVIGLVGLVCVHPARRGQGLSRHLLAAAEELARARGISDLVLWTTKPEVYASAGFARESQDLFVQVQAPPGLASPRLPVTRDSFSCGLPPFAHAAWRWQAADAYLTTVEGPAGVTLAEWQGPPQALLALLHAAMPSRWCVNLSRTDPLLAHLERHGFLCASQPGAWQMRLHSSSHPPVEIPSVPLLERI